MSKGPTTTDEGGRPLNWLDRTLRRLNAVGHLNGIAKDILASIPEAWAESFVDIDPDAKLLKCRTAAAFRVGTRASAVNLMDALKPEPLTFVKFEYRPLQTTQQIWPTAFETNKVRVKERFEIYPFVFAVSQGLEFGPIRVVQWVSLVNEKRFAVIVEIEDDPATFTQARQGIRRAGVAGAFRYRWEVEGFPTGWVNGWFNQWDSDPNINAHCTVFWPTSRYAPGGLYGYAGVESLHTLARRLLEVEEGQTDDTTT